MRASEMTSRPSQAARCLQGSLSFSQVREQTSIIEHPGDAAPGSETTHERRLWAGLCPVAQVYDRLPSHFRHCGRNPRRPLHVDTGQADWVFTLDLGGPDQTLPTQLAGRCGAFQAYEGEANRPMAMRK
jgi:hypothetical protein